MHTFATLFNTFAAIRITWDPMIRGTLIVLTAILFLVGSTYLLLATNTGIRTGFFLVLAGLSGMMFMMCMTWTVYGLAQGPAGRTPSWKCVEIAKDEVAFASSAAFSYPEGFSSLNEKDTKQGKTLGDASAAADKFLVTASNKPDSHGEIPKPPKCSGKTFTAPFGTVNDYLRVEGSIRGGEKYPKPLGQKFDWIAFWHEPKYAVVEVQQVLSEPNGFTDVPRKTAIDANGTNVRILMERDLGSRRFPTFVFGVGFGLLFGLTCYHLHRRERLAQLLAEAEKVKDNGNDGPDGDKKELIGASS